MLPTFETLSSSLRKYRLAAATAGNTLASRLLTQASHEIRVAIQMLAEGHSAESVQAFLAVRGLPPEDDLGQWIEKLEQGH